MTSIIEFRHVSKTFSSHGRQVSALDDLNLSIEQGEIFGIIGYSGAGKSTLVRLINGLERPSGGSIRVEQTELTGLSEGALAKLRLRIGMIFQQFNLLRSRTVAGNVEFPLWVAKVPREQRRSRVAELLDFVGLLDRAHDYPEQLSGGQKQRVGIARALAASPVILLADEATSALDPETTRDVLALLRRVNRELGVTVVVITHEMEVIRSVTDRVAVLDAGQIAEIGSTFEVFATPQHPVTRRFLDGVVHTRPDAEDLKRVSRRHPGRLLIVTISDLDDFNQSLRTAREAGAQVEIAFGGIDSIQGRDFGTLTLALNGTNELVEQAISEFRAVATVEEVNR
ncbi:methionine ABC transporter ATP-binding protein [Psychromicrobium lacuslunae]|uniref:Methionine ABC transporter ATP-binding protein n=1 Tax=Psychromicrobium lacuslunae TaxID=1618207 RepID=A0A0D4BWA4_9MICC|nr:ATP-binding cassette domain-containing protein [Psychromicrobium lacuslunae]AJT40742.1 methionine ABC transporter ATP-binding protein [Psychromicrobium lacuslunae]